MRALISAALLAAIFAAQAQAQTPKNGDLLPRNDIIFYATSDRPDLAYRLFGKNDKGQWRLKAWPYEMIDKDAAKEGADPEKIKQARAVADYVFACMDATKSLELGLLDVTLGGGKFVLILRAKDFMGYNDKPDFLKHLLKEEIKIRDLAVTVYEIKEEKKTEERPRDIKPMDVAGLDRFYVTKLGQDLCITNFESAMTDVIERFVTKDYSESLSSRAEFASWRDSRKPHDLSFYIVGREIQKAVERMLPGEKMTGGRDIEGAYNEADRWLQLREYQSIVIDFDYDEANNGFGIDAKLTTRHKTKLLEQLAISSAEFKLIKYLPADAMLTVGLQIGDPATTWSRFVEFARDGEKIAAKAIEKPKEEPPKDGSKPDSDKRGHEKSVLPLRDLFGAGVEMPEEKPSKVENALREIDEQLAKMGTSVKEILAALGSEVIGHITADGARAIASGANDFGGLFEYAHMGVIVGIKDAKAAQAVLAKVRSGGDANKDTFTTSNHAGRDLNINAKQGWAYVLTDDAVLLSFTRPGVADAEAHLGLGLKRMLDAAKATGIDAKFLSPSSKFVRVDVGKMIEAYSQLRKSLSERLDRYAEPMSDEELTGAFKTTTVSMRTVEDVTSVEFGLRVHGLPNFFNMFDQLLSGKGTGSPRDALRYSQNNVREIGWGLSSWVVSNQGQPTLEALMKHKSLRKAHFQSPFDSRWKGGYAKLGWINLGQLEKGKDGKIADWVDKEAVKLIEENEASDFVSYTLAEGDLRGAIQESKAGIIVLYQTSADTMGGHVVLYADGEVGWLHGKVLKDAFALNKEGKPVPGEDRWSKGGKKAEAKPKKPVEKGDPADTWGK